MPRSKTPAKPKLFTCTKCTLEFPGTPKGAILGAKGMQPFCTDCWAEVDAHGWDDDVATNGLTEPDAIIETLAPLDRSPAFPACAGCDQPVSYADALLTIQDGHNLYWHPVCAPKDDEDDSDDPTSVFHNTGNVIHLDPIEQPSPDATLTCYCCGDTIDTTCPYYELPDEYEEGVIYIQGGCADSNPEMNAIVQEAANNDTLITHDPNDLYCNEADDEEDPPPPAAPLPPIVAVLSADKLTNYKHREIAEKAIREHFGLKPTYQTTSNIRVNKTDYIIFSEQASGRGQLTKAEKATIEPLAAETHAILRTLLQDNVNKYGTEYPTSQMRVSLDVLADYGLLYDPNGVRTTVRQWLDKRPNTRKPLSAKMKDDWTSLFITTTFAFIPTDTTLRPHLGTRYESTTIPAVPPRTETATTWGYWNGTEHKPEKPGYDRDSYVYCQRPTTITIPAQPLRRINRYVTSTPLGPLYTELITEDPQ